MTQRYKATIAYDGSAYAGWQVQPSQRTVQGECERALGQITRTAVRVESSGRTDTGVHARAQVAHFDLAELRDADKLMHGLNAVLDEDVRITELIPIRSDFHARFSALRKEYRYFIWNDRFVPPHLRLYRLNYPYPLDLARMQSAAAVLIGRHDFASFCSRRAKGEENTIRNLLRLEVVQDGHEFTITAVSEGFLYKMVRSLAGFLIRVGAGRLGVEDAERILKDRRRHAQVPSARPQGLFLWQVKYPAEFDA